MTAGTRERIAQAVAVAGGVVALAIALQQDRPASSIAVIVIAVLTLGFTLTYFWRARLPTGVRKYQWQLWTGITTCIVMGIALLVAMLVPSGRDLLVHSVIGFERPLLPEISGIIMGESARYYRVHATVFNSQHRDQQLSHIGLMIGRSNLPSAPGAPKPAACKRAPQKLVVKDRITIYAADKNVTSFQGTIVSKSGGLAGFEVPVMGALESFGCRGPRSVQLRLWFDFNLTLEREATTEIIIDIPKKVKLRDYEATDSLKRTHRAPDPREIAVPGAKPLADSSWQSHLAVHATVGNLGPNLFACRDFRPPAPGAPQVADTRCS